LRTFKKNIQASFSSAPKPIPDSLEARTEATKTWTEEVRKQEESRIEQEHHNYERRVNAEIFKDDSVDLADRIAAAGAVVIEGAKELTSAAQKTIHAHKAQAAKEIMVGPSAVVETTFVTGMAENFDHKHEEQLKLSECKAEEQFHHDKREFKMEKAGSCTTIADRVDASCDVVTEAAKEFSAAAAAEYHNQKALHITNSMKQM